MLVTMNGCGFCGKTGRLESSSTLNPSVSWGAGHHNQGSKQWDLRAQSHCPIAGMSIATGQLERINPEHHAADACPSKELSLWQWWEIYWRYLNLVTRDSHFFFAKKKCPNCWLNSLRHPGSEVMLERVRGAQDRSLRHCGLCCRFHMASLCAWRTLMSSNSQCAACWVMICDDQYAS